MGERRGEYGKDKRAGGGKLHQAVNEAALGQRVYGQSVVGQIGGGDEMSLQITIRLYQSICQIVLIGPHLWLLNSFIPQCKCTSVRHSLLHNVPFQLGTRGPFILLLLFFPLLPIDGWIMRGENVEQPVSAVVFLHSRRCSAGLCLSLYRLPSQGSNLPGLAAT